MCAPLTHLRFPRERYRETKRVADCASYKYSLRSGSSLEGVPRLRARSTLAYAATLPPQWPRSAAIVSAALPPQRPISGLSSREAAIARLNMFVLNIVCQNIDRIAVSQVRESAGIAPEAAGGRAKAGAPGEDDGLFCWWG